MKTPPRRFSPDLGALLVSVFLCVSGLTPRWVGAQDPVELHFKHARITQLEQKQSGEPVRELPDVYVGASSIRALNIGPVWGDNVQMQTTSLRVNVPSTLMTSGGPGIQTADFGNASHVRLNATYVPQAIGEYRGNCLVESQGDQRSYRVEDEESIKVPVTFSGQFPLTVMSLFQEIDRLGEYYVPVAFTTGSEGAFVRGMVEIVYSATEQPIRVDTLLDEDDGVYSEGRQSLREALARALAKDEPVAIPILVSGRILLDSELVATGPNANAISILGNGDVTLDGQNRNRIFHVTESCRLFLGFVNFENGRTSASGEGGAIFNEGRVDLYHCLLRNNEARQSFGGAISTWGTYSRTNLRDCYLDGNRASRDGGTLVASEGCFVWAVNCAIVNSDSSVANYDSTVRLSHCTLYNGRRMLWGREGNGTGIDHCAIAGGPRGGDLPDLVGNVVSLGYNAYESADIQTAFADTDIQADDLFIRPAAGGGVVLLAFSPCVDAGKPDFDGSVFDPPLTTDIVGNPRFSEEGKIDIGAIEVSGFTVMLARKLTDESPDTNGNGLPDIIDVLTGTSDARGDAPQPLQLLDNLLAVRPASAKADWASPRAPRGSAGPVVVEIRIDERVAGGVLTLETSPDMEIWTPRATYSGLGPMAGYARDFVDGATLLSERKAGFVHFLRESVPNDSGRELFVRLRGTQY